MANLSYVEYTADGVTTTYAVPFTYISSADVHVYVDSILKVANTDYTWASAASIQFVVAPAAPLVIRFERRTERTTPLVVFADGSVDKAATRNLSFLQNFYLMQENLDDTATTNDLINEVALGSLTNVELTTPTLLGGYIRDNVYFQDSADPTKQMQIELGGISAGATRILTIPNATTTMVGHDVAQTLSNKTLPSPTLSGTVAGTYTIGGTPTLASNLLNTATGHLTIPVGTSAQRPGSPATGMIRYNSTLARYEGYKGADWALLGGGATGASTDQVFYENDQTVTANYSITSGKNAMSAGPITINSGVTVTVTSGCTWTVV